MQNTQNTTRWLNPSDKAVQQCPAELRACLTESGSLTDHLNRYCKGKIGLSLNNQEWELPFQDESKKLSLNKDETALIREIQLDCNTRPWVFARSVIPRSTYELRESEFSELGLQPLGNLLFSDPDISRSELEVGQIKTDALNSQFRGLNQKFDSDEYLWCRRSVFFVLTEPMLVTEIFLPGLYTCN